MGVVATFDTRKLARRKISLRSLLALPCPHVAHTTHSALPTSSKATPTAIINIILILRFIVHTFSTRII